MITAIGIRGFKSLAHFAFENVGKFTCLVGLNGSGKSSVIQLFDLAAQIMRGEVDLWLERRSWNVDDLASKFTTSRSLVLLVRVQLNDGRLFDWSCNLMRKTLSTTFEVVYDHQTGRRIFELKSGTFTLDGMAQDVSFNYRGSILSVLKPELLGEDLVSIRDEIARISSLEMLSPLMIRFPTREPSLDLGAGGERLTPFLHGLTADSKQELLKLLKVFYPTIVDFRVKQMRGGWKKLIISEGYGSKEYEVDSKHINDGVLRILAMMAQLSTRATTLLFDEVENGVNPEIVERLVDAFQASDHQVIITTHSPMILNYLTDEVARQSVNFVYRTKTGETRVRPMFSLPRIANKLSIMGPGEAFIDTDLQTLNAEFLQLDELKGIPDVHVGD